MHTGGLEGGQPFWLTNIYTYLNNKFILLMILRQIF
jgi:hypothetical protein